MTPSPEPTEQEIQAAIVRAEAGGGSETDTMALRILASALRAEREKVKRIEAERQDLRAELVRLHEVVCEEDAQSIETILNFHDRKAKTLRSDVRERA